MSDIENLLKDSSVQGMIAIEPRDKNQRLAFSVDLIIHIYIVDSNDWHALILKSSISARPRVVNDAKWKHSERRFDNEPIRTYNLDRRVNPPARTCTIEHMKQKLLSSREVEGNGPMKPGNPPA
jgi:hypothetical protein